LSVQEARVPPIVYLACSFVDGIEVWPLCAISFPQWGVLSLEDELLIGRTAFTFSHAGNGQPQRSSSVVAASAAANRFDHDGRVSSDSFLDGGNFGGSERQKRYPNVVLSMDGQTRTKRLRRRVTILGSRHPSTFRVHGLRLSPFDHAIVTVDDSVWLIDLKCAEGQSPKDWITRLVPGGDPVAIGNLQIQQPAICEVEDDGGIGLGDEPVGRREEAGESMLLSMKESRAEPYTASCVDSSVKPVAVEQVQDERVEDDQVRLPVEDDDELATKITDRLVSIQQQKTQRRRLVVNIAYGTAFLVAFFSITWIVMSLLVPAFVQAG
ncbi:hypothetical protein, partial [Novipirellula maiorica]|uniref:hypothetical protein n=1 Tax=Novipirellula maiorica TaxID=1265734 RepID=UPI000592F6DE